MNTVLIRRLRHYDWILLGLTISIITIGLVNLYSATRHGSQRHLFYQQISWLVMGLASLVTLSLIDYRKWRRFAWFFFVVTLTAIVWVHFAGIVAKGSQRWISLGPVRVQPSEFMKLAVILALARYVQYRDTQLVRWPLLFLSMAAFGLAILLVAWQPDFGTATLVALIMLSVALLVARKLWPFVVGASVFGLSVPLLWQYVFHDYQRKRILTFLDPSSDPQGAGYHAHQSIYAIGSGRFWGKGYLQGTQNRLKFLPEQWTDFPFSVWAEEWGVAGALLLIVLYLLLVFWILHIATRARDIFGRVLCIGVAALLFWHVLVNISMVTGLAPVVGVTLPLVSYGGSSVLTVMASLGLVASVSYRCYSR